MSSGGSKPWSCVVLRKNNWRAINDVEEHQDAEEPHRQQRTIDYLSRNERYSDNIEAQETGDVEQDRLVVPASRTTNMDMNIHGREEGEAH